MQQSTTFASFSTSELESKLSELETISSRLDPSTDEWKKLANITVSYCKNMLTSLDNGEKAFHTFDPIQYQIDADKALSVFPEDHHTSNTSNNENRSNEEKFKEILQRIDELVISPGYTPNSGFMAGYVGGGGQVAAAIGDLLADITNVFPGHFTIQPGLAAMELQLIRLLGNLVGFSDDAESSSDNNENTSSSGKRFGGLLTSGGSMATFSAIVTARETTRIAEPDEINRYLKVDETDGSILTSFVVYYTNEAHSCIFKALNLAGCGAGSKLVKANVVAHDENYRMDVDDLKKKIKQDIAEGHCPWLICASAGTVNTGSVDPLDKIAEICKEHKIWFHIDGAYGALFHCCQRGKEMLRGIEQADSLVLDPHKNFYLSYGTGCLLVKDVRWLAASHSFEAAYLTNFLEEEDREDDDQAKANLHLQHLERNLYQSDELGPELSKHARAPRLWLTLQMFGVAPFRSAVEEKLLLAQHAANLFASKPELFQLAIREPDLSIVVFKVVKKVNGDVKRDLTKELLSKLNHRGKLFLSGTVLDDGEFWLRVAIVVFRTHRKHIDEGFQEICECVEEL